MVDAGNFEKIYMISNNISLLDAHPIMVFMVDFVHQHVVAELLVRFALAVLACILKLINIHSLNFYFFEKILFF
jgi:hypothetical protein